MKLVSFLSGVVLFWPVICAAQPVASANEAFAVVYSHVPHAKDQSLENWKRSFNADLVNGVWEIAGKSWGSTHGACVYYVRAKDGRFLGGTYVD